NTHARCARPVSMSSSSGKCFLRGLYKLTVLVSHLRPGQVVLLGVSVFNIADGVLQLTYVSGNAFVTFTTLTCGPFYGFAFTNLLFPLGGNFRQVVGPAKRGAGTVGAVHHNDGSVWQVQVGVERGDGLVIPLVDLAQEDVGDEFAGQLQSAGLN